HAWLIRPSGEVHQFGKDEVEDLSPDGIAVYEEVRIKHASAESSADVGMVFGYESETESRSVFTQVDWSFQEQMPALLSRYTLSLPQGWRAQSVTFNHAPVEPQVSGSTWTWELRNLQPLAPEPARPPVTSLAPRVAVSWLPPAGLQIEA